MLKKTVIVIYAVVILVMAMATFLSQDEAQATVYGAWWFVALWAILSALGVAYIYQRRMRRPAMLLLHTSFLVILLGAFLTHISGRQSMLHLRSDVPGRVLEDGTSLPFFVTLKDFDVSFHEGTHEPSDYCSTVVISSEGTNTVAHISMNNIYSDGGVRLYQNGFDEDMQGSYLSVNIDPYGIPVTYLGYAMLFLSLIWMLLGPQGLRRQIRDTEALGDVSAPKALRIALFSALVASWLVLTYYLGHRWIVGGTAPMTNGYEAMLLMVWLVMLVAMFFRKSTLVAVFSLLASGCCVLVAHMLKMDSDVHPIAPVLSSPLLFVHVTIIMMSYALLALTFFASLCGIILRQRAEQLYHLSRVFLFPAMTCLGIGIFVGAIWANVSWGTYWSWDPKETWALITMMLYAAPFHRASLPFFSRPTVYHAYTVIAFLSVLVTYFGVNYLLGGMHSYA